MVGRRQTGHWIPKDRKGEVGKRLEGVKAIERRKGRCLFVIDEKGQPCGNPVGNNCHVIPNSSVLELLKEESSGKVMELRWGVNKFEHLFVSSSEANPINLDDHAEFEPQLVGTRDACVRWFACKPHDDEFRPIDVGEPDFDDPDVRFLAAYRMALYGADLSRLGAGLVQRWDQKLMRGPIQIRSQWIPIRTTLKTGIPKSRSNATRLGKIWYAWKANRDFDPDIVSGHLLSFRSRLKFAACVFSGKGIVVIVFPVGEDLHKMGVLHLAEDSDSVNDDKERLIQMSNGSLERCNYGVDVVQGLMANGSGVVAASPESYRRLPDGQRLTIQRLVANSSGVEIMANSLYRSLPPNVRQRRR